jgi:hypothetical protein
MERNKNNILFNKKVRKKPFWGFYYKSDKLTLKEKLYKLHYNMETSGFTTKGECEWELRMMQLNMGVYDTIMDEFKKDFIEFETTSKK